MNVLKVNLQQSIQVLHARGWSRRRIARELGIHRQTVAGYVVEAKLPISTAGSERAPDSKAAISTAGSPAGRASLCREFLPVITAAVTAGLSATRIHQDLVDAHSFTGSYESVKRCVRGLARQLELPYRRLECAPGEEMQVDFGQGAWIEAEGKRRRPHLFRAVLSHGPQAAPQARGRVALGSDHAPVRNARHDHDEQSPTGGLGKLLQDVPTAGAILDRFLHHAQVILRFDS